MAKTTNRSQSELYVACYMLHVVALRPSDGNCVHEKIICIFFRKGHFTGYISEIDLFH